MVQVSYPGVYIEEVPSGVRTITGVATSIAAFLGRTSKGPLNKPIRCLSYADFERNFGGSHPQSDLPQSVRLFFENGGTDCFVVRLADPSARPANITLQDLDDGNVLVVSGKHAGLWTNRLRLEIDYDTPNPDESFNLTVIHREGEREIARERHTALTMDPDSPRFAPTFVTQSSALVDVALHSDAEPGNANDLTDPANSFDGYSQSRPRVTSPIGDATTGFRAFFEDLLNTAPNFELNVNDLGFVPVSLADVLDPAGPLTSGTWTFGDMADRLAAVINPQLDSEFPGTSVTCSWIGPSGVVINAAGTFSPTSLRITANSGVQNSVHIRSARSNDFAAPMRLGVDNGGIEVTRHSDFRPVPTGAFLLDPADDFGELLVQMAAIERDDVTNITIGTAPSVALDFTALGPSNTSPWVTDAAGNDTGLREKLRAIAEAVNEALDVPWRAEVWGYHLALQATEGSINTAPSDVSTGGDALLGDHVTPNVRQYALGDTGTSAFQLTGQTGLDGNAPGLNDYLGSEADQTGFHALDPVDLFNLMILPGDGDVTEATYTALLGPASTYCAEHRAFLIVDAPATWTDANGRPAVVQDNDLVKTLRAPMVKDHAAIYYPRLRYRAPDGLLKTIGPSGAIAGLMARIDSTRGVWKAPAGTEATLRGILGLTVNLTDRENGVLNKIGVNCLRLRPSGSVSWGARTLDGDDDFGSEWKYVPIRRTALFLEESLFRGTQWVVFEPNDEPLWANIRRNLNAFMTGLFRQGAFQGTTPQEAFYVKCDSETTTQADRNLGIVNIEVGFAPLKPAEFVIIRIQQIAGDL